MSRGRLVLAGAVLFATVAAGLRAADPTPSPPWHVSKVSRLSQGRPGGEASKSEGDSSKFLHIELKFDSDVAPQKLHEFRVTDRNGKAIAEAYGYQKDRSLVVFEGEWGSLKGLYLEGQGHREPLFRVEPDAASREDGSVAKRKPAEAASREAAGWIERFGEDDTAPKPAEAASREAAGGPSPWDFDPPEPSTAPSARREANPDSREGQEHRPAEIRVPEVAVPLIPVPVIPDNAGPGMGGPGGPSAGGPGAGGPGGGSGGGEKIARRHFGKLDLPKPVIVPEFVLYVSCGEDTGRGKVYQVDDNGHVIGVVHLPYTATGIALHREDGLVVCMPRDGGRLARIDASGKVDPIVEKDKTMVHPIDVGLAPHSDTIVVADDISHVLAATSVSGIKPQLYHRFNYDRSERPQMSVAVTKDKHVIYGTNTVSGKWGVFRYAGDDYTARREPLLSEPGGVAADVSSLQWAATQGPNRICVFDGEELIKRGQLPPNKRHYRNGLLSFAPAGRILVAARPADEAIGEVWLLQYDTKNDELRSLFPWKFERMVDFVVGPRMPWDRPLKRAGSLY